MYIEIHKELFIVIKSLMSGNQEYFPSTWKVQRFCCLIQSIETLSQILTAIFITSFRKYYLDFK